MFYICSEKRSLYPPGFFPITYNDHRFAIGGLKYKYTPDGQLQQNR